MSSKLQRCTPLLVAAIVACGVMAGCGHSKQTTSPQSMAQLKTSLFTPPPAWYIAKMKAKAAASQGQVVAAQAAAAKAATQAK